jgi:hypothetical protein
VGGRVVNEYVGSGPIIETQARLDALKVEELRVERHFNAEQIEVWGETDQQFKDAFDVVSAVLGATFELAGYHRHARGHWRKKRQKTEMAEPKTLSKITPPSKGDVSEFVALAQRGDPEAARQALALVRGNENERELIGVFVDVGAKLQRHMAEQMGLKGPFLARAFERQLEIMREDLGATNAPALEKMLIERVISCWLQVGQIETEMANQAHPQLLEALDRRLQRAHKRHLTAIKALADVRKVNLSIQINLANQQVNF